MTLVRVRGGSVEVYCDCTADVRGGEVTHAMAHIHNAECKNLRDIVDSLVAQQGIPHLDRIAAGNDSMLDLPANPPTPESDTSDAGNIELEIAAARRALQVMGCAAA